MHLCCTQAVQEQRAETELQERLAEKLRAELHAAEHERDALTSRLRTAQVLGPHPCALAWGCCSALTTSLHPHL